MWKALGEDIEAFRRGLGHTCDFRMSRLAVTSVQVAAMSLPTALPKDTDRRRFDHAGTVQAEAIPPDALAAIVREAITARTDQSALAAAVAEEAQIHHWAEARMLPALRAMLGDLL